MGRACSTNGEKRNAYRRILLGKPEGKRPLGKHRRRWEDNVVAYFVKERTVEPEKQPLLANGSETTFVSRQRQRNKKRNSVHF
jgi:hypothetical protein